jgi:hypothetical protein
VHSITDDTTVCCGYMQISKIEFYENLGKLKNNRIIPFI